MGKFIVTDLTEWGGISADTAFSGVLIKLATDEGTVLVRYIYS